MGPCRVAGLRGSTPGGGAAGRHAGWRGGALPGGGAAGGACRAAGGACRVAGGAWSEARRAAGRGGSIYMQLVQLEHTFKWGRWSKHLNRPTVTV